MLLGQVVDAVATPLVGLESDRTNGFCGYSKRKSWHVVGKDAAPEPIRGRQVGSHSHGGMSGVEAGPIMEQGCV